MEKKTETNNVAQASLLPGDPYDPSKLRLDQNYAEQVATKKVLTMIKVGKPHAEDFFRVHPSEEMRMTAGIIELKTKEKYMVIPPLLPLAGRHASPRLLLTCITAEKELLLWDAKLDSGDGRANPWNMTARSAADFGVHKWIKLVSNVDAGYYECHEAMGNLGEPEWPDLPFGEILKLAFPTDKLIRSPDHPVLRKLRGEF